MTSENDIALPPSSLQSAEVKVKPSSNEAEAGDLTPPSMTTLEQSLPNMEMQHYTAEGDNQRSSIQLEVIDFRPAEAGDLICTQSEGCSLSYDTSHSLGTGSSLRAGEQSLPDMVMEGHSIAEEDHQRSPIQIDDLMPTEVDELMLPSRQSDSSFVTIYSKSGSSLVTGSGLYVGESFPDMELESDRVMDGACERSSIELEQETWDMMLPPMATLSESSVSTYYTCTSKSAFSLVTGSGVCASKSAPDMEIEHLEGERQRTPSEAGSEEGFAKPYDHAEDNDNNNALLPTDSDEHCSVTSSIQVQADTLLQGRRSSLFESLDVNNLNQADDTDNSYFDDEINPALCRGRHHLRLQTTLGLDSAATTPLSRSMSAPLESLSRAAFTPLFPSMMEDEASESDSEEQVSDIVIRRDRDTVHIEQEMSGSRDEQSVITVESRLDADQGGLHTVTHRQGKRGNPDCSTTVQAERVVTTVITRDDED